MALDPKTQALLDQMAAAPLPPISELDAPTFRKIMEARTAPRPSVMLAEIVDSKVPDPSGPIPVRIYRASTKDNQPAVVFFHGGGFVIGSIETHDAICCRLAHAADCTIVSVGYALAPEHVYPTAVEQSYLAISWVADNARTLKIDLARIAVAGDSAGGNLAAVVAILARDRHGPALCHQLLIYPVTDMSFSAESYTSNGKGYFLTKEIMEWFRECYVPPGHRVDDPLLSPFHAATLSNLPPATVIVAEYDPLRDDGELYARRLREAGVAVEVMRYDGVIHGFFGMNGVIGQADQAQAFATFELRKAFYR